MFASFRGHNDLSFLAPKLEDGDIGWSIKLGRIAGIDIRMHWTFLLLVGWIFFLYYAAADGGLRTGLLGVGFVLAIFTCVVLHEFGHAITAKRFGIPTRDITLLPIGGVARLQRIPERPLQELAVAAAGPAVNVVIAGILFVGLGLAMNWSNWSSLLPGQLASGKFVQNLMWANIALVAFNLLPAFPMDGGRMLRAILATGLPYLQATKIAASIGQAFAIVFAFAGLLVSPILLFVALFVYLGAAGEARLVETQMALRGIPVREAMVRYFRTLSPEDSLNEAAQELLAGLQPEFPVVEGGRFVGMLGREELAEGLREGGSGQRVGDVMSAACEPVAPHDMLEEVARQMREQQCSMLPVMENEQLVGIITLENIGEMVMINSALKGHPQKPQVMKAA